MKLDLTAAIWQEGQWYVSQCVEIDVASQGRTEDEALRNLQEAIVLSLQDDATGEVKQPPVLRKVIPLTVSA
ncbi:MAG TPA: type II toxin-antitoxin system HicB family antitoxin [Dehalococcoidia bacterium]|jgi:predicted RNase H-like HicB family nuclease